MQDSIDTIEHKASRPYIPRNTGVYTRGRMVRDAPWRKWGGMLWW